MLIKGKLQNFMSFTNQVIDFSNTTTSAIIGRNGHGKSAILESIRYALYGEGRSSIADLVKNNSDSEMRVTWLILQGVNKYKITRGRKLSGSGFVEVYLDGELEASGRAAQEYINTHVMGMDADTFALTSFFGAGENDKLMKGFPSERLEVIQAAAQVDVYSTFHEEAKKRAKEVLGDITNLEDLVSEMESSLSAVSDLNNELEEAKVSLEKSRDDLSILQTEKCQLSADEDRLQALINERVKIETELKAAKKEVKVFANAIFDLEAAVSKNTKSWKKISASIKQSSETLQEMEDLAVVEKKISECIADLAEKEVKLSLKKVASTHHVSDSVCVCPLCEGEVDRVKIESWKIDVEKLEVKIEALASTKNILLKNKKTILQVSDDLMRQKSDLKYLETCVKEDKDNIAKLKKKLTSAESDVVQIRLRHDTLCKSIDLVDEKIESLDTIDDRIGDVQAEIGKLRERSRQLTSDISYTKKRLAVVKSKKKQLKKLRLKHQALSVLVDAFSRYGIPVDLIKDFNSEVQDKATELYQMFQGGEVVVKEVEEKGRPGINFVLVDSLGERSFKQLSEGQKAMIVLSVRLAISAIKEKLVSLPVRFLILDELAGHLDDRNRDSLTRIVVQILKKMYPQVFMVSHVALKDVFSSIYEATLDKGNSTIERIV